MRQQPWPSDSQVTRSANEIQGTSRTSTVRNTTRSCSTLLWFRLWSSACGTASGVAVRKIAVPGTRCGGALENETRENLSGTAPSSRRWDRILRARGHGGLLGKKQAALGGGEQPPPGGFGEG